MKHENVLKVNNETNLWSISLTRGGFKDKGPVLSSLWWGPSVAYLQLVDPKQMSLFLKSEKGKQRSSGSSTVMLLWPST